MRDEILIVIVVFLLALPRTNGNNLAFRKPTQQISTYKDAVASKAVDGVRNGDYDAGSCSHTLLSEKPWWKVDLGKQVCFIKFQKESCISYIIKFLIPV